MSKRVSECAYLKREKQKARDFKVSNRAFIVYLLARSGGDDARRATLNSEDDNRDELDDEGLFTMLAPPRRVSAEECMSRESDWGG